MVCVLQHQDKRILTVEPNQISVLHIKTNSETTSHYKNDQSGFDGKNNYYAQRSVAAFLRWLHPAQRNEPDLQYVVIQTMDVA